MTEKWKSSQWGFELGSSQPVVQCATTWATASSSVSAARNRFKTCSCSSISLHFNQTPMSRKFAAAAASQQSNDFKRTEKNRTKKFLRQKSSKKRFTAKLFFFEIQFELFLSYLVFQLASSANWTLELSVLRDCCVQFLPHVSLVQVRDSNQGSWNPNNISEPGLLTPQTSLPLSHGF